MNARILGIASIVTVLTACSSQPRQPTVNAPELAAAEAPAAATPAGVATPVAATEGNAPKVNRTLLMAGYKPTRIKGEVYYCRSEMVTNTAFKRKVCLNEVQLAAEEKKIQEMRREMLRMQPNPGCFGPTCADP